jgi:hypothetical protein
VEEHQGGELDQTPSTPLPTLEFHRCSEGGQRVSRMASCRRRVHTKFNSLQGDGPLRIEFSCFAPSGSKIRTPGGSGAGRWKGEALTWASPVGGGRHLFVDSLDARSTVTLEPKRSLRSRFLMGHRGNSVLAVPPFQVLDGKRVTGQKLRTDFKTDQSRASRLRAERSSCDQERPWYFPIAQSPGSSD